jgi:hypothetical protein
MSHVPGWFPTQTLSPGVHVGAIGHEQSLQAQLDEHVWVPYMLHAWLALGEQAPASSHPPGTHSPIELHMSVPVPQLPHATI